MHQLTQPEFSSLLHQLHRDNGWLLAQLKDSNAALEQLHDRMESEQQARCVCMHSIIEALT